MNTKTIKSIKQILIALTILLNCNIIISQNLTIAQILEVKKKDLGNVEEYLSSKDWVFLDAEAPSYEKLGQASFAYNKSDRSDNAESFLTYFYDIDSDISRIWIQVGKIAKYTEYINSIKAYGCKLIKSNVEDGNIVKIYRGATITFKITSSIGENYYNDDVSVWYILITSNEDYDSTWGVK
jgi:hypothetical protein